VLLIYANVMLVQLTLANKGNLLTYLLASLKHSLANVSTRSG